MVERLSRCLVQTRLSLAFFSGIAAGCDAELDNLEVGRYQPGAWGTPAALTASELLVPHALH